MKIAFVGKGGSGKTTTTALFGRWLAHKGHTVIAFDADINQHLLEVLGHNGTTPPSLSTQLAAIKRYVQGDNPRLKSTDHIIKTTPPGTGSRLLRAQPNDELLATLLAHANGVWAGAAGELEKSDIGVRCFHGKSGVVELLLGHMVDAPHEYVLVDLTAGADPFASSILAKVDAVCLVVEPSLASLTVYEQFKRYGESWLPPLYVVGNKAADANDAQWLRSKVGDELIGIMPVSAFVKQQSRGEQLPITQLDQGIDAVFRQLAHELTQLPRDWQKYYERNIELHRRNATSWANERLGVDVAQQIDPDFLLAQAARHLLAR